jgi:hypothetical protein
VATSGTVVKQTARRLTGAVASAGGLLSSFIQGGVVITGTVALSLRERSAALTLQARSTALTLRSRIRAFTLPGRG